MIDARRKALVLATTSIALVLSGAGVAGPARAASAKTSARYYTEVELVKDKTKGGKELGAAVVTALQNELKAFPEFVLARKGDGAPKDVAARTAWLEKKGLVGIAIQVTIIKRVEKKASAGINIDFGIKTILITRPGGWMVLMTQGLSEGEGRNRKGVLESVVLGATAGAAENLVNHLRAKPIKEGERP